MFRSLLLFFPLLAQVAHADPTYFGEHTDGFRPRCLTKPVSRDHLFFSWKESEKTEREIWARLRRLPCDRWRQAGSLFSTRSWVRVLPAQDVVFGVRLDEQTREALRQVRYGAQEIRKERTADEWLLAHPFQKYTFEVNRQLTRRFGMGFSGDVYRAWIESSPRNQLAKDRFRSSFESALRDPRGSVERLRERSRSLKILVSLGMGWNPDKVEPGGDVDDFTREVRTLGIPVTLLKNHPYEDFDGNVGILREQLDRELRSGSDVILLGLCKGSVELLAATSAVTRGYLDADRTQKGREPGRGRVLAYVNLSGLIGGTFLGDALEQVPGRETIASMLRDEFTGTKHEIGQALLQLRKMSFGETMSFNRRTWMKGLASDSLYVNVLGIPPVKGYADFEGPFIKGMRKWIRRLRLTDAANDGYIEYPKQEIPAGTGARELTLVFPASHMLWDGVYEGQPMNQAPSRKALLMAILQTVLDSL